MQNLVYHNQPLVAVPSTINYNKPANPVTRAVPRSKKSGAPFRRRGPAVCRLAAGHRAPSLVNGVGSRIRRASQGSMNYHPPSRLPLVIVSDPRPPNDFLTLDGYRRLRNDLGLFECFQDCRRGRLAGKGVVRRGNLLAHLRRYHGQQIPSGADIGRAVSGDM